MKIPAGVDDGVTIRLREHGEAIGGGTKGDLYVHIRVKAHKNLLAKATSYLAKNTSVWLTRRLVVKSMLKQSTGRLL